MYFDFLNFHLLFVHGPKPEWGENNPSVEQWYISARALCLVRPGKDLIVLPGGKPEMEEFADFCCKTLNISGNQILWTSGYDYLLDDGIYKEQMSNIRKITSKDRWLLVPYCRTEPFNRWSSQLNIPVLGDSASWVKQYADKAILHPHVNKRSKRLTPIFHEVNIPKGWVCDNRQDLKTAFQIMTADGITQFILKPCFSSSGEGIIRDITSYEQIELLYNFDQFGKAVLEEMLPYDGISSIQFYRQQLMPSHTDQLLSRIHPSKYVGNIVPSRKSSDFQLKLIEKSQRILDQIKPQGLGGLDFLSVNGEPWFIDPNLGRWTGGWMARVFHSLAAPHKPCYKKWDLDSEELAIPDVWEFWSKLQKKGIAFDHKNGKSGVFPMCWLPNMWATLIVFGDTNDEVDILASQVTTCLDS